MGQTITLFAVSSLIGVTVLADTIRKATWGLGDSTVARIAVEANGGARLTVLSTGSIGKVIVNGTKPPLLACPSNNDVCDRVGDVFGIPRPRAP